MWTDPTAGALIGGGAPHVLDWIHRMLWPRAEAPFEAWTTLAADDDADPDATGRAVVNPWASHTTKRPWRNGKEQFSVTLDDDPQKAKSAKISPPLAGHAARGNPTVPDKSALEHRSGRCRLPCRIARLMQLIEEETDKIEITKRTRPR